MRPGGRLIATFSLALGAFAASIVAQGPGPGTPPGDWPTAGGDAQRTGWLRADPWISREAIVSGGFGLQWTTKIGRGAAPIGFAGGVATGGRSPVTVVSASLAVEAIDTDTGVVAWERRFDAGSAGRGPAACAAPLTIPLSRATGLVAPVTGAPKGGGFGPATRPPYRGGIGEPGEGAPADLVGRPAGGGPPAIAAPASAPAPAPNGPARARGPAPAGQAGPGGGGGGRGIAGTWAVAPDGTLHVLGDGAGKDLQPPAPFVPAGSRVIDLLVANNRAYAVTSGACGDAAGIYARDLAGGGEVASWIPGGNPIGVAMAPDGTLVASIGRGRSSASPMANAIVALDSRDLHVTDSFMFGEPVVATAPIIVKDQDRELVAAAATDGKIYLLDARSLGGADHRTPLFASAAPASASWTSFASWTDGEGLRLTTSDASALVALTVTDTNGAPALALSWSASRSAERPLVVDGVLFVLRMDSTRPNTGRAVLYALDPSTGRSLWDSGGAMKDRAVAGGFWIANSQILVATADGTIYAFGMAMERR